MKLIIGLGNPGEKYLRTRHNLGFAVLDEMAKKLEGTWQLEKKFKAEILKTGDLLLVKPQTFMNQSGLAVSSVANFYQVKPEEIIIIHDDLDLLLGKIKVRLGGAAGGHHGVESVIAGLGTDQFIRVRLGMGNAKSHQGEHNRISFNAEHYVLEKFMVSENSQVKHLLKQAILAINILLEKGLDQAQNQFN